MVWVKKGRKHEETNENELTTRLTWNSEAGRKSVKIFVIKFSLSILFFTLNIWVLLWTGSRTVCNSSSSRNTDSII
jgi:hypothetical protein